MSKLSKENLFLLEFLVDDIKLEKCDCANPAGELCVSFQFLDNVELDVCERDFNPEKKFCPSNENSRTGKSCLFSLTPEQALAALESFDLQVNIFIKTEKGWTPDKVHIGQSIISILNMLIDLLESRDPSPAAKVHQDTYDMMDANGQRIGKITVYIRLSCYGKMIITQFQMNMEDKSVLFKDKEGRSLYRYKKSKRKGKVTKIEDLTSDDDCDPNCKRPGANNMPYSNPNCPTQPCFPNDNPFDFNSGMSGLPGNSYGFGGGPSQFNSPGSAFPPRNMNCPSQPCFPPPQGPSFGNNFANPPNFFGGQAPPGGPPNSFGGSSPRMPYRPCATPTNPTCPAKSQNDAAGKASSKSASGKKGKKGKKEKGGAGKKKGKKGSDKKAEDVDMLYPPSLAPQPSMMPGMGYLGTQFPQLPPCLQPQPQQQVPYQQPPQYMDPSRGMQSTRFAIEMGGGGFESRPQSGSCIGRGGGAQSRPRSGGCGGGCGGR